MSDPDLKATTATLEASPAEIEKKLSTTAGG